MNLVGGENSPSNVQPFPVAREVNVNNFEQEVVMASAHTPVLVWFTATWCGPCKQLGPMLEKVVRETNGKVKLAKVDIDQNQEIAALLRVQSVPTVYAFLRSQPVDGFMGVQPESELKKFIERVQGAAGVQQNNTDVETMTMAQAALDAGDAKNAALMFQKVLEDDPANLSALSGLIRAHILNGNTAEAQQIFNKLPKEISEHKELGPARAALELSGSTADLAPLNDLEKQVQKNPKDLAVRFDYALALLGQNQPEQAIDQLLESIKQNRTWEEEKARTQLVKSF